MFSLTSSLFIFFNFNFFFDICLIPFFNNLPKIFDYSSFQQQLGVVKEKKSFIFISVCSMNINLWSYSFYLIFMDFFFEIQLSIFSYKYKHWFLITKHITFDSKCYRFKDYFKCILLIRWPHLWKGSSPEKCTTCR